MPDTENSALIGPRRTRSWGEALLLRPLTSSPVAALVFSKPGKRTRVILPGSQKIGFYGSGTLIEVDTRERRIVVPFRVESRDTGHFFYLTAQIIYRVVQPERVALEIADPAGELEQALILAAQRIGAVLHIDQTGTLRESLEELLRFDQGSLAERARALGLAISRFDLGIELDPAGRILADLRRERPIYWHAEIASAEAETNFMIRIGGSYRLETDDSGFDLLFAEQFLKNIFERTSQELAESTPGSATGYLSDALGEHLRRDLALHAELHELGIELIRVGVTVKTNITTPLSAKQLQVDAALFERLFPDKPAPEEELDEGPALPDWLRHG